MLGIDVISWMIVPIIVPLASALAMFVLGRRWCVPLGIAASVLVLVSVAMVTEIVWAQGPQTYTLGGWHAPLGITLHADGLSCAMLWMSAVVGSSVSGVAKEYFFSSASSSAASPAPAESFWPQWQLLWSALNGLFLAGDVFNLYVTLELLTLAAVGLIVLAGTRQAVEASLRYLLIALAGSLLYLAGVAIMYGSHGTLEIASLARYAVADDASRAAVLLVMLGLMLKTALFPFHFWLPPAHGSAPAPVSALLSGLVIKGSFYVLLRWWFDLFPAEATRPLAMLPAALGVGAIGWGSLQALLAIRLKMLVAYSTVAQVGYLFLVFGLARPEAGDGFVSWSGCVLLGLSHACAKSSLFLSAGVVLRAAGHDRLRDLAGVARQLPVTFFGIAVASVTLMGLPPTGAFVGKWRLLQAAFSGGQFGLAAATVGGGLLTAAYMFRVLAVAFAQPGRVRAVRPLGDVPRSWEVIALGLALISVLLGVGASPVIALLEIGSPWTEAVIPELVGDQLGGGELGSAGAKQ